MSNSCVQNLRELGRNNLKQFTISFTTFFVYNFHFNSVVFLLFESSILQPVCCCMTLTLEYVIRHCNTPFSTSGLLKFSVIPAINSSLFQSSQFFFLVVIPSLYFLLSSFISTYSSIHYAYSLMYIKNLASPLTKKNKS